MTRHGQAPLSGESAGGQPIPLSHTPLALPKAKPSSPSTCVAKHLSGTEGVHLECSTGRCNFWQLVYSPSYHA